MPHQQDPILRVLCDAYALIADPAQWCRHADARNADGTECSAKSPDATQFCASGAIDRGFHPILWRNQAHGYLARASFNLYNTVVVAAVNDDLDATHGHEAALTLYAYAAAQRIHELESRASTASPSTSLHGSTTAAPT